MRLLNEMTSEERLSHEHDKCFCARCGRFARIRLSRRESEVTWTSKEPTWFPPRRFVNARIRVIEETLECVGCPELNRRASPIGLLLDFEHIGSPEEIDETDHSRRA